MFTALYLKEWKEKALIFFFELGILALLILAQFVLREKKDIREWLIYAVLMLFFPFAALILGARVLRRNTARGPGPTFSRGPSAGARSGWPSSPRS